MAWRSGLLLLLLTVAHAAVPTFHAAQQQGSIKTGTIDDPSGLAASQVHPGIYYTHNDHGGRNRVFAVDPKTGDLKATLTISGAHNTDWETIAVGPCGGTGGGSCMYIGDVGHSAGSPSNDIYKVREPAVMKDQSLPVLQKLHFTWHEPESECLMVDPKGDVYVISRVEGGGIMGKIPATEWGKGTYSVVTTQALNLHTGHHDPLGCDMSADGTEMLIKGKVAIFYYEITNGEVLDALTKPVHYLPYHQEVLGEAIAWTPTADGYYTLSQHHYSHFFYYAREGPHIVVTNAPNPTNTPQFNSAQLTSLVKSFELDGISGLAASRVHDGIYYVHNDAGDTNRIFAMDPSTGEVKAIYTITGATNKDWEDIAVGPCPSGGSCIYIGDTGNTGGPPSNIIYMVKEPTELKDMSLPLLDQLHFRWNEPDCECLMVDPTGSIYLISRVQGGGQMVKLPSSAWGGGTLDAGTGQAVSFRTGSKDPMACDLSADGKDLLIKATDDIFYYHVTGGDVMAAIKTPVATLPYHHEDLGEAIAWTPKADGYYTVGQGHFLPFYYYQRQ